MKSKYYELVNSSKSYNRLMRDGPPPGKLPKSIVCDLDGTLCNDLARRMYIDAKKWADYHSNAINDPINEEILNKILKYFKKDYYVILLTGRPSLYREITVQWLAKYDVPYDALYMKRPGSRCDSVMQKSVWYEDHKNILNITRVYEDLQPVVDMWRLKGVSVKQIEINEQ